MLKVKFTSVPDRYQPKLREHIVQSKDSSWKEKVAALGRDEKGRIKPLHPKPDDAAQDNSGTE